MLFFSFCFGAFASSATFGFSSASPRFDPPALITISCSQWILYANYESQSVCLGLGIRVRILFWLILDAWNMLFRPRTSFLIRACTLTARANETSPPSPHTATDNVLQSISIGAERKKKIFHSPLANQVLPAEPEKENKTKHYCKIHVYQNPRKLWKL